MRKKRLKCCLAIPTYNREDVLLDTLQNALRLRPKPDEILVIDQTNKHEPATNEFLRSANKSGRLRWIRHSPPNLPGARNRALDETSAQILIFIDDDVVLPKKFVEYHLANYKSFDVKAVAGKVEQKNFYYPPQPLQWPRIKDYYYFRLDSNKRIEKISTFRGCNFSLRVDFMKEVGGFDENYIGWAYREDSDASIRIWKSGGTIVYDPKAYLTHLAAPSGGCRIKKNLIPVPEWKVSFPANYFAVRHFFPSTDFFNQVLLKNVRRHLLRKDNVFKFWNFPGAFFSYIASLVLAFYFVFLKQKVKN
jgi:GT2 family glycosyltransferase